MCLRLKHLTYINMSSVFLFCRGPASAGSRGTLRMNGVSERKRDRERDQMGDAAESGKSLFFTVAFIFYVSTFLRGR